MTQFTMRRGALLIASIASLGLTACATATPDAVFFESGPVTQADFVGQAFPVYVAYTDTENGSTTAQSGVGSAEFISEDEIRVRLPGQPTRTYTRVGASDIFEGSGDAFDLEIGTLGALSIASNLSESSPFGGVLGYSGFETAVEDRPLFAAYGDDALGVLFLAVDGVEGAVTIGCEESAGCMRLDANFLSGTISGGLVDGTTTLGGVTVSADVDLSNGQITDAGFEGGTLVYDFETSGGGSSATETGSIANADVTGRFFGENADQVGVIFEGEFTDDVGDTGTFSGAGDAFLIPSAPL